MALFEAAPTGREMACQAVRAVLATLVVRDELRDLVRPAAVGRPTFHAAVATGAVPLGASSISSTLVDQCHSLLAVTGPGQIQLCPDTRQAAESIVTDRLGEQNVHTGHDEPPADRDFELNLVRGLLERSRYRSTSHLVTVFGEAGTGKSAFLTEFARLLDDGNAVLRAGQCSPADVADVVAASRQAGSARPLVVLVDDLHQADDAVLDLVDQQTDGAAAVFVVATARPELLLHRPEWGAGKRDATTITLDWMPAPAVEALWDLLLSQESGFGCELELTLAQRPA